MGIWTPYNTVAHLSLRPKRHVRRFSCFWTAHGRESLYFTMGRPFSSSKLPLCMARSGLPSNRWFLESTRDHTPKWHLNRFRRFLQRWRWWHTDRQTDHTTVCNNRLHLCSTAVQSNNC